MIPIWEDSEGVPRREIYNQLAHVLNEAIATHDIPAMMGGLIMAVGLLLNELRKLKPDTEHDMLFCENVIGLYVDLKKNGEGSGGKPV